MTPHPAPWPRADRPSLPSRGPWQRVWPPNRHVSFLEGEAGCMALQCALLAARGAPSDLLLPLFEELLETVEDVNYEESCELLYGAAG